MVSYELDADARMASVSFQSAGMGEVFARSPWALLVHRACSPTGRVLYIFLTAGPGPAARGGMGRVVHLAVPRDESAAGLAHVCEAFRAFNPAWEQTRVLLVGPDLPDPVALGQAFPAAEVRLSAFHVCKHLQQQVQQLGLEGRTERLILSTLQSTARAPTESSRRETHRLLHALLPPPLLPRVHTHWLLADKIWATHGETSWGDSSDYFKELETVTSGLSRVFSAELFLETCIASLAKYYQSTCSLFIPSSPAVKVEATEHPEEDSDEGVNRRAEEHIRQSLSDICVEPAARLCLSELAVVQKSVQLIGSREDTVSVQILEDAHTVGQEGLGRCTCHFNETLQLPCRHIQAVLNSERKTLQPEMVGKQWWKENDDGQARRGCADALLEDLESSWDEARDKFLAVSSLTAEISRLLACCSAEEFERRCCTLRALADSWIGPYVQVKL
ncbi:ZSWM1 protein, partial [Penelope pileata]|nr:ZSWM1 protein [Penelope pileata]